MSSDIYCGINKVPKNKRLGSMKECAEKKQVSYWGLKKIDTRVLENAKGKKQLTLSKTRTTKIRLDARLKRLTKEFDVEKNKTKKQTIKKDIEKTKKELKKATKDFKQAFRLSEQKKSKK